VRQLVRQYPSFLSRAIQAREGKLALVARSSPRADAVPLDLPVERPAVRSQRLLPEPAKGAHDRVDDVAAAPELRSPDLPQQLGARDCSFPRPVGGE